jgi:hypothetical protein
MKGVFRIAEQMELSSRNKDRLDEKVRKEKL